MTFPAFFFFFGLQGLMLNLLWMCIFEAVTTAPSPHPAPILTLLVSCQVPICRSAKPKARPAAPRRWRTAIRWLHAATWSPACRLSARSSNASSSRTLPSSKVSGRFSVFPVGTPSKRQSLLTVVRCSHTDTHRNLFCRATGR